MRLIIKYVPFYSAPIDYRRLT